MYEKLLTLIRGSDPDVQRHNQNVPKEPLISGIQTSDFAHLGSHFENKMTGNSDGSRSAHSSQTESHPKTTCQYHGPVLENQTGNEPSNLEPMARFKQEESFDQGAVHVRLDTDSVSIDKRCTCAAPNDFATSTMEVEDEESSSN